MQGAKITKQLHINASLWMMQLTQRCLLVPLDALGRQHACMGMTYNQLKPKSAVTTYKLLPELVTGLGAASPIVLAQSIVLANVLAELFPLNEAILSSRELHSPTM